MPNHNTFSVAPIRDLIGAHITEGLWLDPFSRNSPFAKQCVTNDLNPEVDADCHLEALDFLRTFATSSVDGVLFDPPYSPRQISECYKHVGVKFTPLIHNRASTVIASARLPASLSRAAKRFASDGTAAGLARRTGLN